jgi:hypothetical protein
MTAFVFERDWMEHSVAAEGRRDFDFVVLTHLYAHSVVSVCLALAPSSCWQCRFICQVRVLVVVLHPLVLAASTFESLSVSVMYV